MPDLVGLIPAAGRATRLGLGAISKEVLPIASEDGGTRPVIEFLLDAMGRAKVKRAVVVLREGKRDIPQTIGRRIRPVWPEIEYVETPGTGSIPETVDVAYRSLGDADVVLGFPDVRFLPSRALADLVTRHRRSADDITLALFPSERPDKTDMVELDGRRVSGFRVKPGPCELTQTWILAAWSPRFTRYLHELLADPKNRSGAALPELQMSEVLSAALGGGLTIGAHSVDGGAFIDVGTPDDLRRASAPIVQTKTAEGESEPCPD